MPEQQPAETKRSAQLALDILEEYLPALQALQEECLNVNYRPERATTLLNGQRYRTVGRIWDRIAAMLDKVPSDIRKLLEPCQRPYCKNGAFNSIDPPYERYIRRPSGPPAYADTFEELLAAAIHAVDAAMLALANMNGDSDDIRPVEATGLNRVTAVIAQNGGGSVPTMPDSSLEPWTPEAQAKETADGFSRTAKVSTDLADSLEFFADNFQPGPPNHNGMSFSTEMDAESVGRIMLLALQPYKSRLRPMRDGRPHAPIGAPMQVYTAALHIGETIDAVKREARIEERKIDTEKPKEGCFQDVPILAGPDIWMVGAPYLVCNDFAALRDVAKGHAERLRSLAETVNKWAIPVQTALQSTLQPESAESIEQAFRRAYKDFGDARILVAEGTPDAPPAMPGDSMKWDCAGALGSVTIAEGQGGKRSVCFWLFRRADTPDGALKRFKELAKRAGAEVPGGALARHDVVKQFGPAAIWALCNLRLLATEPGEFVVKCGKILCLRNVFAASTRASEMLRDVTILAIAAIAEHGGTNAGKEPGGPAGNRSDQSKLGRPKGSGDTKPKADRQTAMKWKRWHDAEFAKGNYKASYAQYAEEKKLDPKLVEAAVDRDRKRRAALKAKHARK